MVTLRSGSLQGDLGDPEVRPRSGSLQGDLGDPEVRPRSGSLQGDLGDPEVRPRSGSLQGDLGDPRSGLDEAVGRVTAYSHAGHPHSALFGLRKQI